MALALPSTRPRAMSGFEMTSRGREAAPSLRSGRKALSTRLDKMTEYSHLTGKHLQGTVT